MKKGRFRRRWLCSTLFQASMGEGGGAKIYNASSMRMPSFPSLFSLRLPFHMNSSDAAKGTDGRDHHSFATCVIYFSVPHIQRPRKQEELTKMRSIPKVRN